MITTTTTKTTNSITITTPTGLSSLVYHEDLKQIRDFFIINFLDSSLKNCLKDLFGSYVLFSHFRLREVTSSELFFFFSNVVLFASAYVCITL